MGWWDINHIDYFLAGVKKNPWKARIIRQNYPRLSKSASHNCSD
jgi:hypothetical protein